MEHNISLITTIAAGFGLALVLGVIASRQPVGNALLDGFAMGGGFLVVLVVLGGVREMLGRERDRQQGPRRHPGR